MRHIRKRGNKWTVIDLKKNTVDTFQTQTQAELFQVFNGTSEEFWAVEEAPVEEEAPEEEETSDDDNYFGF